MLASRSDYPPALRKNKYTDVKQYSARKVLELVDHNCHRLKWTADEKSQHEKRLRHANVLFNEQQQMFSKLAKVHNRSIETRGGSRAINELWEGMLRPAEELLRRLQSKHFSAMSQS